MTNSITVSGTPPQLAMVLTLIQSAEFTALEPVQILGATIETTLEDDVVSAEKTFSQTAAPGVAPTGTPAPPADDKTPPPPADEIELHLASNKTDLIPWSAQIHGKKKAVNANGTWKLAQGVDRAVLVPQVEAELVSQMAASPAKNETPAPATDVVTEVANMKEEDLLPTTKPTTFAELLPIMMAARAANDIGPEAMQQTADVLGLPNIGALNNSPHLVEQAFDLLGLKLT